MTPHVSIKLLLTQSDDRLARMTAAGHDRAFEAIVDRYRRPLLRYAERFPAAGPAEDVVQAAFVRAWGALREGTEVRDLRPWLYRIVHNTALNAVKLQRGDDIELIESEALGVGPEAEAEIQEELRLTLGGIAALPGRQRDALLAVAVDGRAHADVGRELGITDTAVRQLVRRARASVRAVASALTPYPLIAWIAEAGAQTTSVARISELVGGAGTGAVAMKLGALAATTGALVVAAPKAREAIKHHPRTPSAAIAQAASRTAAAPASSGNSTAAASDGASPASLTTSTVPGGTDRHGGHARGGVDFRHARGNAPGTTGGVNAVTRGGRRHGRGTPGSEQDAAQPTAGTRTTTRHGDDSTRATPPVTESSSHGDDGAGTTTPVSATSSGSSSPDHSGSSSGTSSSGSGSGDAYRLGDDGTSRGPQAPEPADDTPEHSGTTGPIPVF